MNPLSRRSLLVGSVLVLPMICALAVLTAPGRRGRLIFTPTAPAAPKRAARLGAALAASIQPGDLAAEVRRRAGAPDSVSPRREIAGAEQWTYVCADGVVVLEMRRGRIRTVTAYPMPGLSAR